MKTGYQRGSAWGLKGRGGVKLINKTAERGIISKNAKFPNESGHGLYDRKSLLVEVFVKGKERGNREKKHSSYEKY